MRKKANVIIHVYDSIDRAIRQLRKKMEREGVVRDMRREAFFEPRSQKRRKGFMKAVKNNMIQQAARKLI